MQDELNSLKENNAWVLVNRPVDRKIIRCNWVFKVKRDEEGSVAHYKARFVAKGFTQQYGIDYCETFSPVIRHSSIRFLCSLAAQLDLEVDHLDVVTAFLQGDLHEEIYMSHPEGFVVEGEEDKVCLLKRAIYGLKQSARNWNRKAHKVLIELGYKQSRHECCLYFKLGDDSVVIIALYVDDFFLFYNDNSEAKRLKMELSCHFHMKDLGSVNA
jgi:hypothetical protein